MTDSPQRGASAARPATSSRGGGPLAALARAQSFVVPLLALLVAFGIGALIIRTQGINPTYAYATLFKAAWATPDGILRTLQKATPLVLTGLAVAVPLKVGLFNIGAQGQLLVGALTTAYVGYRYAELPGPLLILVGVLLGCIAGALWAAIAGLLKATRGVHEVISTIMLNSIAAGVIDYFVTGPLREPGQVIPRTAEVAPGAMLPDLGIVPLGFPVAVILAALAQWTLTRTTLGFRFRTIGDNAHAGAYAGMNIGRTMVLSMVFAGIFAGLGGAIETLGVTHRYESGFNAGLGFDGITIALLARGNPLGTIPAALLVGTLRAGASALQFETGMQPEIVDMILAITLLLVSMPLLARLLFRRRAEQLTTQAAQPQTGGLA